MITPLGPTKCQANPGLTANRRRCMVFARDDRTIVQPSRHRNLCERTISVSFRGTAGDEESRTAEKTFRARFLAALGMTVSRIYNAPSNLQPPQIPCMAVPPGQRESLPGMATRGRLYRARESCDHELAAFMTTSTGVSLLCRFLTITFPSLHGIRAKGRAPLPRQELGRRTPASAFQT